MFFQAPCILLYGKRFLGYEGNIKRESNLFSISQTYWTIFKLNKNEK